MRVALICVFMLVGCTSVKEATLPSGAKGVAATCDGGFNSWSDCYDVANKQCAKGFTEVDRETLVVHGRAKRTMWFTCKA